MILLLVASTFQPVIAAPLPPAPPPMVSSTNSMPPVITPVMTPYNRPAVSVRVRAYAGRQVLLQDEFRVGRMPAMYNLTRSEADQSTCPNSSSYGSMARSSVNFSLRADGASGDGYRVSFGWSRPTSGCASEGTLSVTVDRAVELRPGRSVTVEGDGGLRVELTRL